MRFNRALWGLIGSRDPIAILKNPQGPQDTSRGARALKGPTRPSKGVLKTLSQAIPDVPQGPQVGLRVSGALENRELRALK